MHRKRERERAREQKRDNSWSVLLLIELLNWHDVTYGACEIHMHTYTTNC